MRRCLLQIRFLKVYDNYRLARLLLLLLLLLFLLGGVFERKFLVTVVVDV